MFWLSFAMFWLNFREILQFLIDTRNSIQSRQNKLGTNEVRRKPKTRTGILICSRKALIYLLNEANYVRWLAERTSSLRKCVSQAMKSSLNICFDCETAINRLTHFWLLHELSIRESVAKRGNDRVLPGLLVQKSFAMHLFPQFVIQNIDD